MRDAIDAGVRRFYTAHPTAMKEHMMTKTSTLAALLALALVTGCASTGKTNTPTAVTAQPTPAAAPTEAAQPLRVPALAAKKVVLGMTGPAAVTQAKDWPAFKEEWRARTRPQVPHGSADRSAWRPHMGDAVWGAGANALPS